MAGNLHLIAVAPENQAKPTQRKHNPVHLHKCVHTIIMYHWDCKSTMKTNSISISKYNKHINICTTHLKIYTSMYDII